MVLSNPTLVAIVGVVVVGLLVALYILNKPDASKSIKKEKVKKTTKKNDSKKPESKKSESKKSEAKKPEVKKTEVKKTEVKTPQKVEEAQKVETKVSEKKDKKKEKFESEVLIADVETPVETPVVTAAPTPAVSEAELALQKKVAELEAMVAAATKAAQDAASASQKVTETSTAAPISKKAAKKAEKAAAEKSEKTTTAVEPKVTKAIEEVNATNSDHADLDDDEDGVWVTVSRNKKKTKSKSAESEVSDAPKSEPKIREIILIPSDKRGLIAGRNGETIKKLIAETGASIEIPRADAKSNEGTIEGTPEQVKLARTSIKELMDKGYTRLFNPELTDATIIVPVDKRTIVIGPKGAYLRKIIDGTSCNVVFPERSSISEKVKLIGSAANVKLARDTITSLLNDGFSPLTHEDWVKTEVDFPAKYRGNLIGQRGQTIKSIQGNTKCKIIIPKHHEDTISVVGPADKISLVEKQINRLVEKIETPVVDIYEAGFGPDDESELEEDEEW